MSNSRNPLPPTWRFDYGDYLGLGSVFQKFVTNLNLFTLYTYNLLNGGLGFSNLQRSVYTISGVVAGTTTPISFVNPLPVTPSGVVICQAQQVGKNANALTSAISAANWYFDGTNINILNVAGLVQGVTYNLSMEVF